MPSLMLALLGAQVPVDTSLLIIQALLNDALDFPAINDRMAKAMASWTADPEFAELPYAVSATFFYNEVITISRRQNGIFKPQLASILASFRELGLDMNTRCNIISVEYSENIDPENMGTPAHSENIPEGLHFLGYQVDRYTEIGVEGQMLRIFQTRNPRSLGEGKTWKLSCKLLQQVISGNEGFLEVVEKVLARWISERVVEYACTVFDLMIKRARGPMTCHTTKAYESNTFLEGNTGPQIISFESERVLSGARDVGTTLSLDASAIKQQLLSVEKTSVPVPANLVTGRDTGRADANTDVKRGEGGNINTTNRKKVNSQH